MESTEVVIIGAGVTGVSLAYHLANLGIKSTILEREHVAAAHASGKNAGMIRQLYRNAQLTEWAAKTILEMPLKEKFFVQTGSVIVGREVPDHHQELFTQESNAVRCNTDGLLDSGSFVQALLIEAKNVGVKSYFNHEVEIVEKTNKSWKIYCKNKKIFKAEFLVNATGAWSNQAQGLPNIIETKAYARHLAVVDGFADNYMPAKDCGFYWDEEESWYMRIWDKNSRLVSICDENACCPDHTPNSINITETIAKTLIKKIPEQANNLRIKSFWHCYRTYTEDRLPVIGPDYSDISLFWLSGFGGFGMSTAYAATKDLARLIAGKQCQSLENFTPSRCTIKAKKLSSNY